MHYLLIPRCTSRRIPNLRLYTQTVAKSVSSTIYCRHIFEPNVPLQFALQTIASNTLYTAYNWIQQKRQFR
jgi:hypothetical protein